MPDLTGSVTDAQWTRMQAAAERILGIGHSSEDLTISSLGTLWKSNVTDQVKGYEKDQASVDDF